MKKTVLALILLCTFVWGGRAQTVVENNLIDAVTLYGNGQYTRACDILQILSNANPQNDAVWYYLGEVHVQTARLAEAESALKKAVALDSGNYWYRRELGRVYLMQNKAGEGTAIYESLVKDFPRQSTAVYELLDLYLAGREYEKALETLQDIERQRGPSETLVRTQYDVLAAMGRHEEGVALLEKFNEQYSSPTVLSILGDCYLADFADSLAAARYREALSLDSGYPPAVLGMSEVYRHQRQYPKYFETLHGFFTSADVPAPSKTMYINNMTRSLDPKILQLHREGFDALVMETVQTHPTDSSVLSAAGGYFYRTGREKDAGTWFKAAASAYPESLSLVATYIQYLSLQEDWPELRRSAEKAYDRLGEVAFLDYANMASYELGDYDTIITHCEDILARHPQDKDLCLRSWSMIGDAYHSKGNDKQAFKAYDKALQLDADYAPVLNNYAYYLSLQGRKLKKAYNMSKKTVEAQPDNATYLDTFAWILHLMGKDLEAKPFFKHAMLYGGKDSAVILEHYATVLEALGEEDTAKVYRNMAARLNKED